MNTEAHQSSTLLSYKDALRILRTAQQWLHSDCAGKPLIQRISEYTQQAAEHAADKLARLQNERPDRVHVLVLGEFKAGKSTLINALVGRVVAAVDVFEMTQAVCRIVPQTTGKEEVILQNKNGNETKNVSLDEFLRLSQERKLAEFTQADVYVSAPFDLILVDTPGLGATLENENNALDALAATDVVLYTVDAENMGAARDTALLNRIQEINLPFRCILTKADVLEAEEVEQAVAYLSDELGIDPAHIFPVSASRALLGRPEAGIDKLKRHLSGEIAPRGKKLREQAQFAQLSDAAKEFSVCITAVETSLDARLNDVEKHQLVLRNMAQAVTNDLCAVARVKLDEQLVLDIEKPVVAAFKAGKRFQDTDVRDIMGNNYSTNREQDFANALTVSLQDRFQQEWINGVSANIDSLLSTVGILKQEADLEASQALQNIIDQENLKKSATFHAVAGTVAGVAGTVIVGVLGGIVAAGPLLYLAYEKWQKADHRSPYEQERELRVAIAQWREKTVNETIEGEFRPRLIEINDAVAEQSRDNFARNSSIWPLSFHELQQWRKDCETTKAQLGRVMDASSNARVKRLM